MKPYVFFEADKRRAIEYFDLEECEDDAAAIVCARAITRRDHHAVEIWDGPRNLIIADHAEGPRTSAGCSLAGAP